MTHNGGFALPPAPPPPTTDQHIEAKLVNEPLQRHEPHV